MWFCLYISSLKLLHVFFNHPVRGDTINKSYRRSFLKEHVRFKTCIDSFLNGIVTINPYVLELKVLQNTSGLTCSDPTKTLNTMQERNNNLVRTIHNFNLVQF